MDNHVDPEIIAMLEQLASIKTLAGKMASKSSESEALIENKSQNEGRAVVISVSFIVGVICGTIFTTLIGGVLIRRYF